MHKMTLLEMTQNILSSMNSDEVNSISDTVESLQVAEEIRNTFRELYSNRDIAEFEGIVNLQAVGDASVPNRLVLPSNVLHVKWIMYKDFRTNSANKFHYVDYLPPEEFIKRIVEMDMGASTPYVDVPLLSTSPVTYSIKADSHPHFYTVLDDDTTLIFDSYDADEEDFLTSSNAIGWGVMSREFELVDEFIPPIDANLFPHLLAEAKSACFINIKEVANSKEEQRARRQLIRTRNRLNITADQREGVFDAQDYSRNRTVRSAIRRSRRFGQ